MNRIHVISTKFFILSIIIILGMLFLVFKIINIESNQKYVLVKTVNKQFDNDYVPAITGTGVLLTNGKIITVYHNVEISKELFIEVDNNLVRAELESYDKLVDFAILRLTRDFNLSKIKFLTLPSCSCLVTFNGLQDNLAIEDGHNDYLGNVLVIKGASIEKGNSGSPVFNNGKLIGLIRSRDNHFTYASKIE